MSLERLYPVDNIFSTLESGSILKIRFVLPKIHHLHRAYLVSGPIFFLLSVSTLGAFNYHMDKNEWVGGKPNVLFGTRRVGGCFIPCPHQWTFNLYLEQSRFKL